MRPTARSSIERTAQQKLAQQIRGLEQENARVREELALFESMLSSETAGAAPLSILRFKVEPDVLPGEFRYRVLLLASGPRRGREFQGRLELVVGLTEDGRSAIITVPGQGEAEAAGVSLGIQALPADRRQFPREARRPGSAACRCASTKAAPPSRK